MQTSESLPCRDTYFGGYAADVKSGVGLYVFGSGASYLGSYVGGKRQGRGMMVMPDTGIYEGQWAEDRFDGQVGVRRLCGMAWCTFGPPGRVPDGLRRATMQPFGVGVTVSGHGGCSACGEER